VAIANALQLQAVWRHLTLNFCSISGVTRCNSLPDMSEIEHPQLCYRSLKIKIFFGGGGRPPLWISWYVDLVPCASSADM